MRWLAVLLLAGCAVSPDLDVGESSVVLGDNNFVRVAPDGGNVPARYRPLLDAIGRSRPNFCTITHLGNGIAITAGHCFAERGIDKPCTSQSGDPVWIDWGVRGGTNASGYMSSRCMRILASEFHEEQTDYAIIEVSPAPTARAHVTFDRVPTDTTLTIFSHPLRRPLEWSQLCTRGSLRTQSVFTHDCDTDKGSSGAAVFVDGTLAIAGVHNGGQAGQYNYGTFLADTPLRDYLDGTAPTPDPQPSPEPPDLNEDPGDPHTFTLAQGESLELGPYSVAAGNSLKISTTGVGDVDLFARKGAPPVGTTYDCYSAGPNANESCTLTGPAQVYVHIDGFAPSSTFDLLFQ